MTQEVLLPQRVKKFKGEIGVVHHTSLSTEAIETRDVHRTLFFVLSLSVLLVTLVLVGGRTRQNGTTGTSCPVNVSAFSV